LPLTVLIARLAATPQAKEEARPVLPEIIPFIWGNPPCYNMHAANDSRRASAMNISFDIPKDIEQGLAASVADLNADAREIYLVNLYREDRITHHQLTEALGLTRIETDGVLKRHKISSGPTLEELRAEIGSLREAMPRY
jgi:hypothetical protein